MKKEYTFANLMLILVFIAIFIVPVFPSGSHRILYNILYTAIFFMAVFAVNEKRGLFLGGALVATGTEWVAFFFQMTYPVVISKSINMGFFLAVVIFLIRQIAASRQVTARVILESINGYLLLGMGYAFLVGLIVKHNPDAFTFADKHFGVYDFMYFSFVTLSTLGYGDITPNSPYAKSLSILVSVTGQIYLTVIIAMLVGKYISTSNKD